MTINEILELVGQLDDAGGDDSGRMRFRKYLDKSVSDLGVIRDYVEACLKQSGPQFNRALQDLVNHIARLMGFTVTFGRYSGVVNAIGFDGIWEHDGLHIVVEVKTTDAYTIHTATLLGYINELIGEQKIPDQSHALGLYIVGRTDAALQGLENAIVAQHQTRELRIATVESIVSLAELLQAGLLSADEIVAILRPDGVFVDDTVKLLTRIAAQEEPANSGEVGVAAGGPPPGPGEVASGETATRYLLTPVADEKDESAEEGIKRLLGHGWYVFGEATPGRKLIKPDDRICFYRSGVGVVAAARIASYPEKKPLPFVKNLDAYPWAFQVDEVKYFFAAPIVIDAALRAQLDAFKNKDLTKAWAFFVMSTRVNLTPHDFALLTGEHVAPV